ncbi:MAG: pre-peptidase C-terminal domain-containing protein [Candidatus Thalassarchaeaceae archaeon]
MEKVGNGLIKHHRLKSNMQSHKRIIAPGLILMMLASTLLSIAAPVQANPAEEVSVLHTEVNPANNKTYHLLTASSWEDAAFKARSLNGYLTTIDDADENTWVFDTFASFDNQSRHLWIGLNDVQDEGIYRWHDGTPFLYRNWGVDQPTGGDDSDYVHIASTNMGNIMPQTWNDLENNPEYFPVYGVVEVGPGADFSLRFDGYGDHIVVDHDEGLSTNGSLSIEATIKANNLDGIRFITMKGDYGWGMYLSDGYIGYASEYSLSKHPLSNTSITEDSWFTIGVSIIEGVGGEFTIDGVPAGNISAEDALIPVGDFGSNDCFTSGDSCDELYIARMGAGCDCYYFEGIIDDVTIGHKVENGAWTPKSHWAFSEGEGDETGDLIEFDNPDRLGEIIGADWVMPDGSIVAQAVELLNDEYVMLEDIQQGDTLLFYADIDEYTIMADVYIWGWSEDYYYDEWDYDFEGSPFFNAYVGYDRIPAPWDYDEELTGYYGSVWNSWTWPEADIIWFSIDVTEDIEEFEIQAYWEVAEEPPSLDEMTELYNGVPVTSQSIQGDRDSYEATLEYYFVNVTDSLTELKIETYGGKGDVDIVISSGGPVDPNYNYYYEPYEDIFYEDESMRIQSNIMYSTNGGNDEEVNLFDVEPGIYYITAYTYRKANDFTIVADFTYAPTNADPSTAVELQPGIAYGPMSGYDGLDQYFFIDVPSGTERLEVDLDGGFGEATLHLRYENTPTASEADHHSGSPGAGDKVGFNNPTPGKWYILLDSMSVFSGVSITASFEDLYVWEYDGTPIELFNDEEVSGLSAPAGEELYFYVDLATRSDELIITTFGGEGSLIIMGDGEIDYEDFFGFDDMDFFDEDLFDEDIFGEQFQSYGEGTFQELYVYSPASGRFDITLIAQDDFSDVSIVAYWKEETRPGPTPEPEPEPEDIVACDEDLKEFFEDSDINGDGFMNADEFRRSSPGDIEFNGVDQSQDGLIEFTEVVAYLCNCENELLMFEEQLPVKTAVDFFETLPFKNEYSIEEIDSNDDGFITSFEIEKAAESCATTYNPFDRDGDGVPDIDDQFPDDPDEQKDVDGDGIGDNADFAPSVANDIVYGAGGALLIVLIGLMVLFLRSGNGGNQQHMEQEWNKTDAFAEQMLQMNNDYTVPTTLPSAPELESPSQEPPAYQNSDVPIYDLGQLTAEEPVLEQPSTSLMGMMDSKGREHIEFPANSGKLWYRDEPDSPWIKN